MPAIRNDRPGDLVACGIQLPGKGVVTPVTDEQLVDLCNNPVFREWMSPPLNYVRLVPDAEVQRHAEAARALTEARARAAKATAEAAVSTEEANRFAEESMARERMAEMDRVVKDAEQRIAASRGAAKR